MKCSHVKGDGMPCQSPENLVDEVSGLCRSHDPRFADELAQRSLKGGIAMGVKLQGEAFTVEQIKRLASIEDAKTALDDIRIAVLTRRISHNEGSTATKAVEGWVKADAAERTKHVVDELTAELEKRKVEIEELRKQLQTMNRRPVRIAR